MKALSSDLIILEKNHIRWKLYPPYRNFWGSVVSHIKPWDLVSFRKICDCRWHGQTIGNNSCKIILSEKALSCHWTVPRFIGFLPAAAFQQWSLLHIAVWSLNIPIVKTSRDHIASDPSKSICLPPLFSSEACLRIEVLPSHCGLVTEYFYRKNLLWSYCIQPFGWSLGRVYSPCIELNAQNWMSFWTHSLTASLPEFSVIRWTETSPYRYIHDPETSGAICSCHWKQLP